MHWPFWAKMLVLLAVTGFIFATVFVVLHHAEAVARRVGEPYGTLILTFAVTIIEASVIVSMMLHGENNPTLARESVFSTVMIVCAGVVGVCLTLGGLKHRYQDIKRQGTSAYLAVLMALTVLALILPDYTLTTTPGTFSAAQLVFASLLSVLLYGAFVFARSSAIAAISSRPDGRRGGCRTCRGGRLGSWSACFCCSRTGRDRAARTGGQAHRGCFCDQRRQVDAIVGFFIAVLVLMPENASHQGGAQQRTAARPQRGAWPACATIGLTIPAVAAASLITGKSLTPSWVGRYRALVLALAISVVSFGTSRTTC